MKLTKEQFDEAAVIEEVVKKIQLKEKFDKAALTRAVVQRMKIWVVQLGGED